MNRDTLLYMLKNFVDIRSLIKVWMSTCRKLRNMLVDPGVLIDYKLAQYRAQYPIIDLYMTRGKTQALIYAQPFKFLLACEDLDNNHNVITEACAMLSKMFSHYEEGKIEEVGIMLDRAEKQKFKAEVSDYYGLLIPPQYAQFISLCHSSNLSQNGLAFAPPSFTPYCWQHGTCEGIMQFANWQDGGSDGSSYLYLVCDVHSPWYGRFVYYTYRRDGQFHVLKDHWSFTEFLQLLLNHKDLTKKHIFECLTNGAALKVGNDTYGIVTKPIGHFFSETHYY